MTVSNMVDTATVAIGGIPVELQWDDADFRPAIERAYADFLRSGPADVKLQLVNQDLEVHDPDAEMTLWREGATWHFMRNDLRAEWNPLTGTAKAWHTPNPFSLDTTLRVLHSLLLAERGGFLMHAASAVVGNRAFVFPGVSGAGKSTISRLAPPAVTVLTDEISYVSAKDGGFRAWGTPFSGDLGVNGPNTPTPVQAIYLLAKGPENRVEGLSPQEAVAGLLRNVLFFAEDDVLAGKILETVCRVVENIPVQRLYFRPDPEIWKFIAAQGACNE